MEGGGCGGADRTGGTGGAPKGALSCWEPPMASSPGPEMATPPRYVRVSSPRALVSHRNPFFWHFPLFWAPRLPLETVLQTRHTSEKDACLRMHTGATA